MKPGRTSGKSKRRRIMAKARDLVRREGGTPDHGWNLPPDDATREAIEIVRPSWWWPNGERPWCPWPTLAEADTDSPPSTIGAASPGYDDNEP